MKKMVISALCLVLGALCLMPCAAWGETVTYRAYDAATGQFYNAAADCEHIRSAGDVRTLTGGWYVVGDSYGSREEVLIYNSIRISGDVHLILCDNATLTIKNVADNYAALEIGPWDSLTIYGQSKGSGALLATGGFCSAAIGGSGRGGNGGTLTINGGRVTANGGFGAAGIGGGYEGDGCALTVRGGTVTANCGFGGADIGGGYDGEGGAVTINGGSVKANSILNPPKNANGAPLHKVTVKCEGIGDQGSGIRLEGLNGYGTNGLYPIDGCLYLYLPDGDYAFSANGKPYSAKVDGADVLADRAYKIEVGDVPEHVSVAWIDGGGTRHDVGHVSSLAVFGDQVGVLFMADEGYGIVVGSDIVREYVVDLGEVTEDIVFGDGNDYAVPQELVETATVTITRSMKHLTAVWTAGGDESVTNTVRGGSFLVRKGTEDVKVIFALDPAYELVSGNLLVELGTVDENKEIKDVPQVVHRTIEYVDSLGRLLINDTFSVVTAATETFSDGWYLVEGDVVSSGIDVQKGCEVRLILADGASLTVAGADHEAGIDVGPDEVLSIYGQTGGTGRLTANGGVYGAGIGGGYEGDCGVVMIYGGTVVAKGGFSGAGIGGGWYGAGGVVTISGGTVIANGGPNGAGIGGGCDGDGGTVTINGGTVTAIGKSGAGIGGGYGGAGGDVTINGGTVTATSGGSSYYCGAGIGGGYEGDGGTVAINGGRVTAVAGRDLAGRSAAVIGRGLDGADDGEIAITGGLFGMEIEESWPGADYSAAANPEIETRADYPWTVLPSSTVATVTVGAHLRVAVAWTYDDGAVTNALSGTSFAVVKGTKNVRVLFEAQSGYRLEDESFVDQGTESSVDLGDVKDDVTFGENNVPAAPKAICLYGTVTYLAWDETGGTQTVARIAEENYEVVTSETRTLTDGWYVVADDIVIDNGENLAVNGSAHLILFDGASLTVTNVADGYAAIEVADVNSLAIYGQTGGTGRLTATGGFGVAGIGGTVTINGGVVTAVGGRNAAGISADSEGAGDTVTINGGVVTATGGELGAGIGGGNSCAGGDVTIRGGRVTATGGQLAAGIGGGAFCSSDGTVGWDRKKVTLADGGVGSAYQSVTFVDLSLITVTCADGMAVWNDDLRAFVVTPNDGVTEVTVEGLPDWAKVVVPSSVRWVIGAGDRQIRVFEGDDDVTGRYLIQDGAIQTLGKIAYRDWDEEKKEMTDAAVAFGNYEVVTEETRTLKDGKWYVVADDVVIDNGDHLAVNGSAHLILCDGASLTVANVIYNAAIEVAEGNSLAIYGQSGGTGRLSVTGATSGAGIGGGEGCAGGDVTINGGTVTANGGSSGAGIGGGIANVRTSSSGDIISATGGNGGEVVINGGRVTANGGIAGAGIGGGMYGAGGSVTINGGTVTAMGGRNGAGIGGGFNSSSPGTVVWDEAKVKMLDGDVGSGHQSVTFADISSDGVACEGGRIEWDDDLLAFVVIPENVTEVSIKGLPDRAKVVVPPSVTQVNGVGDRQIRVYEGIDDVTGSYLIKDGAIVSLGAVKYRNWDDEKKKMIPAEVAFGNYEVVTEETRTLEDGKWYVVADDVVIDNGDHITVNGSAHLILFDGASLTVDKVIMNKAAIEVADENSLSIYGQTGGTGRLTANGGELGAGIGGGDGSAGGSVTINGGMVTANGGRYGAGIGGGFEGAGGDVTINGGMVTANGGSHGAGIGGGFEGAGGDVTINGGIVEATGGEFGVGIGGGDASSSDGSVYRDEERVELVDGDVGRGYSFVKFAEIWTGPTCEGGDIAEGEIGEWVVTPDEDVTEVTITGLAEGETVAIKLGDYVVPSAAFVGFGDGQTEGVFSLALDEAGEVNGVRVQPIIGDLDENEGAPFVVGEGGVTVTVRAIPGLKYELRRWEALDTESAVSSKPPYQVVTDKVAEGASVTLSDDDPPADKAFYAIGVSVP